MDLKDKVVVVTGAASGIGRALAQRFAAEGARTVVAADVNDAGLAETAAGSDVITTKRCDVSTEQDIVDLVESTISAHGPIDLFCSNAGIAIGGGAEVPDAEWDRIWKINTMAHVWAARALLPHMLARGEGYLLNTVSAAGLLTNIGAAPYSVTKHAAVGFAEWLSVTYGNRGVVVQAICPQGVQTRMLDQAGPLKDLLSRDDALTPEQVADAWINSLADDRFLVLPHPEVAAYYAARATDTDAWLARMRRLQDEVDMLTGTTS